MNFLPVVERELRVAARRRTAYWSRVAAAIAAAAVAAWILTVLQPRDGSHLFIGLAIVLFLYAAFVGIFITSDSLSEEKRDGTLGLLFLTDLKANDLVVGKLVATSVNAFYGMLAVVPVLALSWMLGGVSGGQVCRVVVQAINLLFFFASVGLVASALCRQANRALVLAMFLAAIFLGGGLLIQAALAPTSPLIDALASPLCGCALAASDGLSQSTNPSFFWSNVALTNLYAWCLFGLACWLAPRCWQSAAEGKARPAKHRFSANTQRRAALLDRNPFLWRAAAQSSANPAGPWLLLLGMALLWLWLNHLFKVSLFDPTSDLLFLILAGAVFKGWLAGEASCTFSGDRRGGAMELLLTTPLRPIDIIRGQRSALWRQFAAPVTALLAVNAALLPRETRALPPARCQLLICVHFIVGVCLVLEMLSLTWVGMWLGLTNRKPNRAAIVALIRILVLPYALFFAVAFIYASSAPVGKLDWSGLLIFPSFFGLATSFFFALDANSRLLADFKIVVSEGIIPKRQLETEDEFAPVPITAK